MKAMILAAGYGTRLRPLTGNIPKPLVPIMNRPLILHNLLFLKKHGIEEIMINLHYLPEMIPDYLGDGADWGLTLHYSQEPRILGTAGGIKNVKDFFQGETFLVMNADVLIQVDLQRAISSHRKNNALGTMVVSGKMDISRYGVVGLDEEGHVCRITDRVGSNQTGLRQTVFLGIHILEPEILRYFPETTPSCINADVYPAAIRSGEKILGYRQQEGYWSDLGTPGDYLQAHWDILDGKLGLYSGNRSPAHIAPSACIVEPVRFGSDVVIQAGAVVGPYCIIGNRVSVGKNCRIKESVLWEGSRIPQETEITGSIVESISQKGTFRGKIITTEGVGA